MGTATASVSNEVAAVQRLMKASGLSYTMHSAGTTVGKAIFLYSKSPPLTPILSIYPPSKGCFIL
jgi:hypothetical protein